MGAAPKSGIYTICGDLQAIGRYVCTTFHHGLRFPSTESLQLVCRCSSFGLLPVSKTLF